MSLKTYFLLTLRYMNPQFKSHLYPMDWKTLDYWKRALQVSIPFPLLCLIFFLITINTGIFFKEYVFVFENVLLVKISLVTYLSFPPIIVSYLLSKRLLRFYPSKINQYDRKTLDVQLVMLITASIVTYSASLLRII